MDLSILIVTYNSRRLIDPLLTHLQQELAHLDAEVVLVDNASITQVEHRHHPGPPAGDRWRIVTVNDTAHLRGL